jgi:hypothetical protein
MKFLAAMLFLVIPASAVADVSKQVTADGTLIITISGLIQRADEKKFEDAIPVPGDPRTVIINLNSRGGYNWPASRIGLIVRERDLETRIVKGSICNSACTLIFFAGTYRSMEPGTSLGLHSGSPETGPRVRDDEVNKKMGEYLARMGAPQYIIDLQPKADPCCANYVSWKQAEKLGILKGRPVAEKTATNLSTGPPPDDEP